MTLACTIDATGISAPDYPTVLAALQEQFQSIYGTDVYIDPDSQDGALLAIFALAISDTNAATIAAYNNFSPSTAQGEGLSSVVKINGLKRLVPTFSTVQLAIGGSANTPITNGLATDTAGNTWALPASVTIPPAGTITVTGTCTTIGAVTANTGDVNTIGTPTRGWQTVTNIGPATVGQPVETDAQLRLRQAVSTMIPSLTVMDGIQGALLELAGVARVAGYENSTANTDGNGLPSHSVAFVVDGGDNQAAANIIAAKKGPGVGTYGTTSETVTSIYNIPATINFFRPSVVPVYANITLKALPGYTTLTGAAIAAAAAAYISALPIAAPVELSRLYVPINAVATTFNVTGITLGRDPGSLTAADLVLAFTEAASGSAANITITAN